MGIRELRLAKSMSQKRLAFEAGIDARTLRKIEQGVTVSPESLWAVCRILEVDPEDVLLRKDMETANEKPVSSSAETSFSSPPPTMPGAMLGLVASMGALQLYLPDLFVPIFTIMLFIGVFGVLAVENRNNAGRPFKVAPWVFIIAGIWLYYAQAISKDGGVDYLPYLSVGFGIALLVAPTRRFLFGSDEHLDNGRYIRRRLFLSGIVYFATTWQSIAGNFDFQFSYWQIDRVTAEVIGHFTVLIGFVCLALRKTGHALGYAVILAGISVTLFIWLRGSALLVPRHGLWVAVFIMHIKIPEIILAAICCIGLHNAASKYAAGTRVIAA